MFQATGVGKEVKHLFERGAKCRRVLVSYSCSTNKGSNDAGRFRRIRFAGADVGSGRFARLGRLGWKMSALQIPCVTREEEGLDRNDAEDGLLADVIPFPRIVAGRPPSYAPARRHAPREVSLPTNSGARSERRLDARSLGDSGSVTTHGVSVPPTVVAWVVRAVVYLAMTAALFSLAAAVGLAIRPAPYSGPTWEHSVAEGESVWSLAASIGSDRGLEDVVTDIYALNSLDEGPLVVGQEILLPTR